MDRAFQRIRSLMLRGTFYSVPPNWKEDEKNAIRYYKKYMATVPEDQRYALDEDGNPVEDRITLYQQAWKRIKKIKEEGFFRGDIPTKSFPVEKKDTLALRHAK